MNSKSKGSFAEHSKLILLNLFTGIIKNFNIALIKIEFEPTGVAKLVLKMVCWIQKPVNQSSASLTIHDHCFCNIVSIMTYNTISKTIKQWQNASTRHA